MVYGIFSHSLHLIVIFNIKDHNPLFFMCNIASDRQDFVHFLEFFHRACLCSVLKVQVRDSVSDFETKLRVGVKPLKIQLHKC